MKFKNSNSCIIAHGDLDGIISAAVLVINLNIPVTKRNIIYTQPFELDKIIISDWIKKIYVTDIAVNNREPEMTKRFIDMYREEIVLWIDHHIGYSLLEEWLGEDKVIAGDSPSCPQLMKDNGFIVPEEWLAAANAADRPTDYPETDLSRFLNKALKAVILKNGSNEIEKYFVMENIVLYLVKSYRGKDASMEKGVIESYGKMYDEFMKNTEEAVKRIKDLELKCKYKVGYLRLEKGEGSIDLTRLFIEAYKIYDIVIVQRYNIEEEVTIISTKLKEIDLVKLFDLVSGASFRVTLKGSHKEILEIIKERLERLR